MKPQRYRLKEWKNGKYPKWTARIIWFEQNGHDDIRLQMEDCDRQVNVYPNTKEAADNLWFMFKQGAPPEGDHTPFISDLLDLIRGRVDARIFD